MQLILYIIASAVLAAFSNLWVRKSITHMYTHGDPFPVSRLLATGFFIMLAGLLSAGTYSFTMPNIILGFISGIFLGLLMWASGYALSTGPSGLSIAIVNSACIMPPLMMALVFGSEFGHVYTPTNALGNFLVLIGLLLASHRTDENTYSRTWIFCIGAAFIVHVALLTLFQWRALLLKPEIPLSYLIPFKITAASAHSFGLIMASTAALLLFVLPIKQAITKSTGRDIAYYGILGGALNGIASFFTLKATEIAQLPWEKATIFPLYCVLLITFCAIWAKALYKEKIAWFALFLCFCGIILSLY